MAIKRTDERGKYMVDPEWQERVTDLFVRLKNFEVMYLVIGAFSKPRTLVAREKLRRWIENKLAWQHDL